MLRKDGNKERKKETVASKSIGLEDYKNEGRVSEKRNQ